jgi:hypothetical protein
MSDPNLAINKIRTSKINPPINKANLKTVNPKTVNLKTVNLKTVNLKTVNLKADRVVVGNQTNLRITMASHVSKIARQRRSVCGNRCAISATTSRLRAIAINEPANVPAAAINE